MMEGTRGHAAALEVLDLEVRFASRRLFGSGGEVRAVDGVSFHVDPGEVFCIAGESGCGKTTLGRALLGLVKPHSGKVSISGLDPARLRGEELRKFRRQVQVVFQDPMGSLNPRQSVYEAVAEGVRIHGLQGDEKEIVARPSARWPETTRALLPQLPARAIGWTAPAGGHRGRHSARAPGTRRG
jgi:ABC-type glutathione transport system ATPase component